MRYVLLKQGSEGEGGEAGLLFRCGKEGTEAWAGHF